MVSKIQIRVWSLWRHVEYGVPPRRRIESLREMDLTPERFTNPGWIRDALIEDITAAQYGIKDDKYDLEVIVYISEPEEKQIHLSVTRDTDLDDDGMEIDLLIHAAKAIFEGFHGD